MDGCTKVSTGADLWASGAASGWRCLRSAQREAQGGKLAWTRDPHTVHTYTHICKRIFPATPRPSRPDVPVLVLPWSCLRSHSLVCLIIAGGLDAPCLLIATVVIFTITFAIAVIKAKAVEEVVHVSHFLLLVSVLPVAL